MMMIIFVSNGLFETNSLKKNIIIIKFWIFGSLDLGELIGAGFAQHVAIIIVAEAAN